jgi:hypothetical protein
LNDLDAVAELDVAIVTLGDDSLLAVIALDRHLNAATAAHAAAVAVHDRAGNGAADDAQDASNQAAAKTSTAGRADCRAAKAAQQAADQGSLSRARAGAAATLQADVIDGDDPAARAGRWSCGRCRLDEARLHSVGCTSAKSCYQSQWQQGGPDKLAPHENPFPLQPLYEWNHDRNGAKR